MEQYRKKILYSREVIDRKVKELAAQISRDFSGKDLVVVGVLKGSFMFMADLIRAMTIPCTIDFIRVTSYGAATVSSGKIEIKKDIETAIAGRDVLVVEDIVDTGLTLAFLRDKFLERVPRSLRFCTLIDKKHRREVEFHSDYVGFDLDQGFVVGYGLDFDEKARYLPDVYVLEE
ncbi:MAG TPA: hypoxanthine phosphoribosyltransferase [Syntrophales bacterium]|jgi:hypoxanthine phosphoribosyltransferase|nr:hypoxanthine phosphoribosyltransferase [Syntrophales bacterium]HRT61608.1 hypoxanthine phosphoribosyltransferase [Syntrophales bacterium]